MAAFAAEMLELGYVEGQNLITEVRAAGRPERFPDRVSDVIRLKVDVIVAWSTAGILAAKQATTTIPIVMGSSGDAVADGLVRSLSRPGGNITGLSMMYSELLTKYIELVRAAVPRASRIDLMMLANMQAAAKTSGMTIQ